MNHKLVTEILAKTDCWKLVEMDEVTGARSACPVSSPELAWSEA
jgi:UDP-3-O-[3-hydroxymyristoyl] N-acetylglucosamine deacetylase